MNLTLREAMLTFKRAPLLSALSVTTIAFSLFVLGLFGLVVGAAFAAVAIIIIGTTIRMAVLQRSREIAIMRLVGATDGFIRRPFLLQGAIKGLLGGLVAVGLSFGAYLLINRYLLQSAFFTNGQALAIVGLGAVIGLLGSATSVGRHLKRV